jgi:hypothetical protein
MAKDRIDLEALASELHADITRAESALLFHKLVLVPLASNPSFRRKFQEVYDHLESSTIVLSFMTLARMYDKNKGGHSITLQELMSQVDAKYPDKPDVQNSARQFVESIVRLRTKLTRLRVNVIAHKNYIGEPSKVRWKDLEDACSLAKDVLGFYGGSAGQGYIYRRPGFEATCATFTEEQLVLSQR